MNKYVAFINNFGRIEKMILNDFTYEESSHQLRGL
jgi:hypothetical protein